MTARNSYVLRYPNGHFVAFDNRNGGRPHEARALSEIATWPSAEAAEQFRRSSNSPSGLTVHRIVELVTEPLREGPGSSPMQEELAQLAMDREGPPAGG